MPALPDPRPLAFDASTVADPALADCLRAVAAADWQHDRTRARQALVKALRTRLAAEDDAAIEGAAAAATPALAAELAQALDAAIHGTGDHEDVALIARVFLLPVVCVTAGLAPAAVPGTVPDIDAVVDAMRSAAAFGPVDAFGLGNALASDAQVAAIAPSRLFTLARAFGDAPGSGVGSALLHPDDLALERADEQVHLRYLAGASIAPAAAPTFVETAGQVGRWGMAVSRALAQQLAVPGLTLLPLPRAPRPWFAARGEGRFAREELAFNLFATGAIRAIRAETGDPDARVASHADGSVRVSLWSPFEPQRVHAHAWRLDGATDLVRVTQSIADLLRDCRLERVEWGSQVEPATPLPIASGPIGLLPH